jgi:hypothetical protein
MNTTPTTMHRGIIRAADRPFPEHWPRGPVTINSYRVQSDAKETFLPLLLRHWRLLHELGLVTDDPVQLYSTCDADTPTFVEIFTWADDGEAVRRASQHAEVRTLWREMDNLLLAEFVLGTRPLENTDSDTDG